MLKDQLVVRLSEPDALIQVLSGPRQVGKTTALRAALAQTGGVYESADSPVPFSFRDVREWWQNAERRGESILAVDEIQKVAQWTEAIKQLWDREGRTMRLCLTGSAALTVQQGLSESLAGRYERILAEHWHLAEAVEAFGATTRSFVEYGCYPGSMRFLTEPERWAEYVRDAIVEPALGRDLLQLHPIEQPALLRQLFGVAVAMPAQIVSFEKIQGQLQGRGTLPTLGRYLRLLESAFLVSGIDKYSGSAFRLKRSSPKLIVHDNALLRAFERPVDAPLAPARFGHYFENAVGARFIEAGWATHYWRDRQDEVDFVVIGPRGQRLAIEVKSSPTDEPSLCGLRRFCTRHPEFEPCLVSWVDQELPGVRTLPTAEVLSLHRDARTSFE